MPVAGNIFSEFPKKNRTAMLPANLKSAQMIAPAELGYAMPAEWEPHAATWLGWPHHAGDWPGKFEVIPWIYGEMVRKISAAEKIFLLVRHKQDEAAARRIFKHVGVDLRKIHFVTHPTNRGWTRDTGPIFVRKSEIGNRKSEMAVVHFHFNGWAKYGNWRKDTKVPDVAAKLLGKKLFHSKCGVADSTENPKPKTKNFVIEGGGIEVNGCGTLLATEQCYLDPKIQVRNPGLGQKEIEAALKNYLGVKSIFWLAKGPVGDDTHGHIDDICRFVNAKTLVLVRETNSKDENFRPLAQNWERIQDLRLEDGGKPEVIELPMPAPLYFDGVRLPASYANFYICNAAVIVPTFNDPNDRVALGILGELFRDRPVVGIHAVDLVWGFGSLHCLTQQQPAELWLK
jgi:agmatine deiminase